MKGLFSLILSYCAGLSRFGRVRLFATLWTVACQAPLSTGFSRQESWRGLPFPTEGDANPRTLAAYRAASGFSNLTWLCHKSEIIPALEGRLSRWSVANP